MKILNRIFVILCLIFLGNTVLAQPNSTELMSEINSDEIYQKDTGVFTWGELYSWLFRRSVFNKSYALIIGIGDYNEWPTLESPYHDAIQMRDFLIKDANFDYVFTLTNASASKERINALMEDFFPNILTENDRFLFYFSGHGTQRQIGDKLFGYLVLQNSESEKSYGSMINMLDIERWDNLIYPTRHALFILDSCFSGIAGQQLKSPLDTKKIERLSQYGHHLITAGTANEESFASMNNWGGSLFTYAFLEAARGKADLRSVDYDADGIVSLKELMKYIEDYIDQTSVALKAQHPLSKKGITMSPQISNLQQNKGEFFFISDSFKEQYLAGRDVSALTYGDLQDKGLPIDNLSQKFLEFDEKSFHEYFTTSIGIEECKPEQALQCVRTLKDRLYFIRGRGDAEEMSSTPSKSRNSFENCIFCSKLNTADHRAIFEYLGDTIGLTFRKSNVLASVQALVDLYGAKELLNLYGTQLFENIIYLFEHEWQQENEKERLHKALEYVVEQIREENIDFDARLDQKQKFLNPEYENWNGIQKFFYRFEKRVPGTTAFVRARLQNYLNQY